MIVEDCFIKVLTLFLKSVRNFSCFLLISDWNIVFKGVQGETRLQGRSHHHTVCIVKSFHI